MIPASYYLGLSVVAVLTVLTFFLSKEQDERIAPLWTILVILYIGLGIYLFGWIIGIANIPILIVLANVLDIPIERGMKRVFPNAKYRWGMSLETRQKLSRWGRKMGLPQRKL
jgi:hypothetical protein